MMMACSWYHPGYFGVVVPVFHVGWWDVWASIHEPGHVQEISSLPFLAFVLDVFLGDSSCLLGWNVEVFLLCLLRCVRDFWCSPYVVPECICFLSGISASYLLLLFWKLEYTLPGCVLNILFILYFSVLAVYLWSLWDTAINLCFPSSIADFRHPFLLYCFTVTSCILDFPFFALSILLMSFLSFLILFSSLLHGGVEFWVFVLIVFCVDVCHVISFAVAVLLLSHMRGVSLCDILCMYHMDCMISFSCLLHYLLHLPFIYPQWVSFLCVRGCVDPFCPHLF